MTIVPPSCYALDPDAKTITFTAPYDTLTVEEFLSIYNLSKQCEIYDSKNPRKRTLFIDTPNQTQEFDIAVTGAVLTYIENAEMLDTDKLQIVVGRTIIDGGTP